MNYLVASIAVICAAVSPAFAQFSTNPASGGSGTAPGTASGFPGVQQQPDSAITNFDGLDIKVTRLIKDPSTEGGFRLIMTIIDTGDAPRRLAFIQPAATLTDDLGNTFNTTAITGVAICTHRNPWDVDLNGCRQYQAADTVRMTKDLPTPVVMTVQPSDQGYSKELAELATVATLQARLAYYSDDFSTSNYADIVINGIEIPRGGS